MKKIFLLLTMILLLDGCSLDLKNSEPSIIESENLRLGFCPTMQEEALVLQAKNPDIRLMPLGSAAEVLQQSTLGQIDLALVGRKAKTSEITPDTQEKNLETKPTYTLVAPQKQTILESNLSSLEIFTCLEASIQNQFPGLPLNFQTSCDYDNGAVWLIAWSEMTDDRELLIPINERGAKTRSFRNAFLYGSPFNNIHF